MSHAHLGLFDTPFNRRQVRFSLALIGLLVLASLPVLFVRNLRLPEVDAFMPTVDAIMFIGEVITATLLYAQASVFRARALVMLGGSYLFTALLLLPHALTYPGAFSPNGLLGAGLSTSAWITYLRQMAFALGIILYVRAKTASPAERAETEARAPNIPVRILAVAVLALAATILTTSRLDVLPAVFLDRTSMIRSHVIGYEGVSIALWIVAGLMLLRRLSSVLDLWLLVASACWMIVALLVPTLPARFTAGFYWLSIVAMFGHLVVMLALIAESTRLHARLGLSMSAWSREREARLMSIDAMAAAISYEVGQPLAAVRIHANAGLTWLSRDRPNTERAMMSMRATLDAGNLAVGVIKGIQETFAKKPSERATLDLAHLVRATVPLLRRELASERISLRVSLDETLPPVLADRVQLQRVLINLLSNAIESLAATKARPRRLTIRSGPLRSRGVVLEICDNGVGIAPQDMAQIFDPFFTTKSAGAGLGLPLCRIIVEAHGGRLWASCDEDHGACFHLELPAGGSHVLATVSERMADPPA